MRARVPWLFVVVGTAAVVLLCFLLVAPVLAAGTGG
jgi:hypothetical protein